MTFVHVVDIDAVAEGVRHARAAHAQHDLLLQAVVCVAAVQVIGQAAVPSGVAVEVGIEKVDGHDMSGAAAHVVAPGAHGNNAVFNGDRDTGRFLNAESIRVPGLNFFALHTGAVEMLLEVPFAMQQRESDEGNAQVGRRSQRIACENAEAARIGGHGLMDCNLHREIRNMPRAGEVFVRKWL